MDGQRHEYDWLIKLLLVGDCGVGKTSMMLRYADNAFSESVHENIGIDFKVKSVDIDGQRSMLQIWEISGQEFRSSAYYRSALGVLVMYDVTNERSFQNVRKWMEEIKESAQQNVNTILVSTKCDVDPTKRLVTTQQGQDLANMYGVKFWETSAKNVTNIDEAFRSIIIDIQRRLGNSNDLNVINHDPICLHNALSNIKQWCWS